MRALVFTAPNEMNVLDVDDATASDGDVVLRVEAVGVCGSELHGISGAGWRQPPLVMGHEVVGTDPDGQRVAVNPLVSCGRCDSCVRGAGNLCRSRQLLGVHRPGGYAERVVVSPASLHRIPDELGWDEAALIEPLANAVHAARLAGDLRDTRVGVIGAGALGLLCTSVVAQSHPAELTVADPSKERLEVAERVGARHLTDRLSAEFDVIIDAVGAGVTRTDSLDRLRPGGLAVWLGLAEADVQLDGNAVVRQEKRVTGSFAYTDDEFAEAIRMSTLTDLGWTTSVDLEDSASVFMDLARGRSDIVRAVIRP